jgi:hypothetical protein
VGECLFRDVEAGLAYVHVGGVEIVLDHRADISLDEERVFAYFFKLVAFVFEIDSVLVL